MDFREVLEGFWMVLGGCGMFSSRCCLFFLLKGSI